MVFRAALQVDQLLNILCSTGNYANAARSLIEVFATSYKITQHLATHNRLPEPRNLVLLAELTCAKADIIRIYCRTDKRLAFEVPSADRLESH